MSAPTITAPPPGAHPSAPAGGSGAGGAEGGSPPPSGTKLPGCNGFAMLANEVLDSPLPDKHKLVYAALARAAHGDTVRGLSLDSLQKLAHVSYATLKRALNRLEAAGLLIRERLTNAKGGSLPSRYILPLIRNYLAQLSGHRRSDHNGHNGHAPPAPHGGLTPAPPAPTGGAHPCAKGGLTATPNGGLSPEPPYKEPNVTKHITPKMGRGDDAPPSPQTKIGKDDEDRHATPPPTPSHLWDDALRELSLTMYGPSYDNIERCTAHWHQPDDTPGGDAHPRGLTLIAPNDFIRTWLEVKVRRRIEQVLARLTDSPPQLTFTTATP